MANIIMMITAILSIIDVVIFVVLKPGKYN